jgi:hypothetical protein
MRIVVTLILLSVASSLKAGLPTYGSLRNCVEKGNPTNNVPATERVFVCPDYHQDMCPNFRETFILRYRENMTLRQIVDQTNFKDSSVHVWVFRKSDAPIFRETVEPTDNPRFTLRPEDVILIYEKVLDI